MGLSLKEKREIIRIAGERHRLYLLGKFNYSKFVKQVGEDTAAATFEDLKKTRRKDARVSIAAYKCREDRNHVYEQICDDAWAYRKSLAISKKMTPMKRHLAWAMLSHLILLAFAIWFCVKPWINGTTPTVDSREELIKVGVAVVIVFLLFVWAAKKLIKAIELK